MADEIRLAFEGEDRASARYYDLHVNLGTGGDVYSLRCNANGFWEWYGDPDFPMKYDTFSGVIGAIAQTYDNDTYAELMDWAYEQEGSDDEE